MSQDKSSTSPRPGVFLDRDGVINRKPTRARYVRSWDEFEWLPGAKKALRLLKEAGYLVMVVTNQAGVGRGTMSENAVAEVHERMRAEARKAGGDIAAVYCCTHRPDDGCECRKPKPGMLFRAQRDYALDLGKTYFVGDDEKDREAANGAGCPSLLVSESASLLDHVKELLVRQRQRRP